MLHLESPPRRTADRRIAAVVGVALMLAGSTAPAFSQESVSRLTTQADSTNSRANWALASQFDPTALKSIVYSDAVQPRWLGKTDSLWYNWRDHTGSHFYLVVPATKTKRALFNQEKLAAALTELSNKAADGQALPFQTINFTKDHKSIRFTVDSVRYDWSLAKESLRSLGRMKADSVPPDEEKEAREQGGAGGRPAAGAGDRDFRNYSPDSTAFAFAREHNLYLVEVATRDTIQITTDGVKDYSFGFQDTTGIQLLDQSRRRQARDRAKELRVHANVVWSPDSRAFAVVRNDSRKVNDLYLVNVLSQPRPTLMSYKYAMPGEKEVPQQELSVFRRGERALKPVNVSKWKDQRLMDIHWTVGSQKLRLTRRDRLQRDLELIEVDLASNAVTPLITESIEHAVVESQPVRYVRRGGDMVWWSERSGWGQYYLYDNTGHLKRPMTTGAWHADRIEKVDTLRGTVWINGEGREPGENPYLQHMYRVNGDGTGFALLDSGNYNHDETLSPTNRYMVDNYSRVDYVPQSVIRDASGRIVMKLENMDISPLTERGWKPAETFMVKAADGVTDIYGNMWKPFNFDSTKKYPIIAHVYPGPQTESVNNTFRGTGGEQQLAQLGFIVIQIGNRGGSPIRSVAYHRYGYGNLRDYALADKKTGIEQLAARHNWIDLNNVGIYGHSGGGFLTGAALLEPPYNDFFKVGVSSSGNHDNNIYNQNWSEENHGLQLRKQGSDSARSGGRASGGRGNAGPNAGRSPMDTTGGALDSTQFQIHVPTNIELAKNLKGNLLLVTGTMDNNVHPGNTIRLVDALIRANKRFDFMVMPAKPHGYGDMQPYFNRMMMEYFAEHLLHDYNRDGADYRP
jgi:dipeptidyl aminopeptidase/acylaminoacyl peptidase